MESIGEWKNGGEDRLKTGSSAAQL